MTTARPAVCSGFMKVDRRRVVESPVAAPIAQRDDVCGLFGNGAVWLAGPDLEFVEWVKLQILVGG